MAESDSFIQEVSEEVRRDKMYAVWRRYGPWLIAVIVIAVLLAAGKGWMESRDQTRKAELGGALLAADAIDDPAEASAAFLAVAEEGEYDYPVLARLRAGAALMQAGRLDESQEQYELIKSMEGVDPRFSELADLRIVMMRSGTMDPDEMLGILGPLTVDGSVWRLPALEYEAAAHLKKGDPEAALASLRTILDIPQLAPAAQGRARELVEAIEATLEVDEPVAPVPAPTDAAPGEEETAPGEVTPAEPADEEATPATAAPDESAPAETALDESAPEETGPEEIATEEDSSPEVTPEETPPAAAAPVESTAEEPAPAETAPEEATPAEAATEEVAPAEAAPEEETAPAPTPAAPARDAPEDATPEEPDTPDEEGAAQ